MPGSIGVPWPDTEAIIMSLETGEALPPGEIGESSERPSNYERILE